MPLASDVIGGLGGVMLAVPPLRDQYHRFKQTDEERRVGTSSWPALRLRLSNAWRERRDAYDGLDSALTALGSLLIVLAFGLKLFDL